MTTPSIAEEVLKAERGPEPGTFKVRDIIHKGDEGFPAAVVASALSSAGYCWIYDTKTAERSLTNLNMLPTALRKRREDGSIVFTTVKPSIPVIRGAFKCRLHADDASRSHYDTLGLPVCRKSNLTSPFQVLRHMQKRHRMEWETIELERTTAEKEGAKAHDAALLAALTAGVVHTPTPVLNTECAHCGNMFVAPTEALLRQALFTHRRGSVCNAVEDVS